MPRLYHCRNGRPQARLLALKIDRPSAAVELRSLPDRWNGNRQAPSRSCRRNVESLSDDAGSFRRVIRRRRPDGRYHFCRTRVSRGAAFLAPPRPRRRSPPAAIARPSLSRAADRPLITHGIQSGDVSIDSGGGLGARRPAVAHAGRGRDHRQLQNVRSAVFVDALPETDFTAKALIEGLPAGQDIFYRIRFQDHCFRRHS